MRLLLDTCTLLWLQMDPGQIPPGLSRILSDPQTRRFLSASVAWEIAIKWACGRLALPCPPDEFLKRARRESILDSVPIFESAALQVAKLPALHADPFDRILIAQAIELGVPIATSDHKIRQYPVRTIWD